MKTTTNYIYGQWLSTIHNWDVFVTIRYGTKSTSNRMRNLANKLIIKDLEIESLFYISERDKNYTNHHSHMLIKTSNPTETRKILKSFSNYGKIHIEPVKDNTSVCIYITKWIDKNLHWDLIGTQNKVNVC